MKNLSKNVTLYCDICGNDQFSTIDNLDCELHELQDASGETKIKCSDCGKIFTKDELIELNQEVINANIEDVKKEAIKEFEKDLSKILKKWK